MGYDELGVQYTKKIIPAISQNKESRIF